MLTVVSSSSSLCAHKQQWKMPFQTRDIDSDCIFYSFAFASAKEHHEPYVRFVVYLLFCSVFFSSSLGQTFGQYFIIYIEKVFVQIFWSGCNVETENVLLCTCKTTAMKHTSVCPLPILIVTTMAHMHTKRAYIHGIDSLGFSNWYPKNTKFNESQKTKTKKMMMMKIHRNYGFCSALENIFHYKIVIKVAHMPCVHTYTRFSSLRSNWASKYHHRSFCKPFASTIRKYILCTRSVRIISQCPRTLQNKQVAFDGKWEANARCLTMCYFRLD